PPVYFKQSAVSEILIPNHLHAYDSLSKAYADNFNMKREKILELIASIDDGDANGIKASEEQVEQMHDESMAIRGEVRQLIRISNPGYDTKDSDYVFLTFILNYLPRGVIGLLIAVIFAAAMSSTSSELNALASTTTVDFYRRLVSANSSESHYVLISKILTAFWGFTAILFALFANQAENLIEAVNIVGSLFYGTILGIFVSAFFFKTIRGTAIFAGSLAAEAVVIALHILTVKEIINLGYLWYNAVGLALTVLFALIIQAFGRK
ncbi:MAG TPA: hypothetical protein VI583_08465, partial [Cyclobacteriaceae bacterium]|nr:hypothetical protein [Cyclobacteriaceae bacterium]